MIKCDNCNGDIFNPNWQRDNLTYSKELRIEVVYCDECKCPCGGIFNKENLICNKCGVDKLVLDKFKGERCLECGYLLKNCECKKWH
jgi:hypothetical protein